MIDTGLARGVDWSQYQIKMVLAGEVGFEGAEDLRSAGLAEVPEAVRGRPEVRHLPARHEHQQPVTENDVIGIGRASYRLVGDELRKFIDTALSGGQQKACERRARAAHEAVAAVP